MKTTIKRLFALALIGCSIFSLAFSVSASDATGAMNGAMRGDATSVGADEAFTQQFTGTTPAAP